MLAARIFPFARTNALRHGRFGNEKGVRDLCRREAAQKTQRQGDLGIGCEGRVAAGEDEAEAIVSNGHDLGRFAVSAQLHGLGLAVFTRRFTAKPVDGTVPSGRDDPSSRTRG